MKLYLLLLIVIVTSTSCYHVYYAPNTAHSPLLSEKGEVRVNGFYSSGADSDFEGGEIQVASAVSDHIGIMANGFFAGTKETVDDWNGYGSHPESGNGSYIELAGGAFTAFDPKKRWIGEVYAGIGSGTVNSDYGANQVSKVNSTKLFLQPAVGYKTRYFEFSLVPKISFVNWKVKSENISDATSSAASDMLIIKQKPNLVHFEPALLIRAGSEHVKLQSSLSFSSSHTDAYPIETLTASIGVSINMKPKKK